MTASRLTAVVLVSAVMSVAIPATASATDTGCDGSDALLRLSLDEECGLAATVLGIDVRLGGSEPEAEPDPKSTPSPTPSPSPSSAPPSTDSTDGTGDTDGTIDANGTGDAGSAAEESAAAGGTRNGPADAWAGTDGSPLAAGTTAAAGSPAPQLSTAAEAEPADPSASIRPVLETPAIAEVDARERLSEPPSQRSPWTRITGPLARLPGLEQPPFVTAGTVILAGLALIAIGVCAAATGLTLAFRRRRSVSSL